MNQENVVQKLKHQGTIWALRTQRTQRRPKEFGQEKHRQETNEGA